MQALTLVPETIAQRDGAGPVVELPPNGNRLFVFTLEINRAVEQESLEIEIWGSGDEEGWGEKPLMTLPRKFYCGVYSALVNLVNRPEVKYLQVKWRMRRWARGRTEPLFGFTSFMQESGARLSAGSVQASSMATVA